jgi:hypothetical protein
MRDARRYPAVGGLAAWRRPALLGGLAVAALVVGEWTVASALAATEIVLELIGAAVLFEVSPRGLARGLALRGVMIGHGRVLAWEAVEEVATRWYRPGDCSMLETIITTRDRERLSFSTRMGLRGYWRLLADVTRHAPHARHTGLTVEVLSESPSVMRPMSPRRRAVLVAGLVVVAVCALLALAA